MTENTTHAVHSSGIDELTTKLEEKILEISFCFEELDKLMEDSKVFFKKDASIQFQNKYEEIKNSFPIIKKNLEGYKEDFIIVKNNHIMFDQSYRMPEPRKIEIGGEE